MNTSISCCWILLLGVLFFHHHSANYKHQAVIGHSPSHSSTQVSIPSRLLSPVDTKVDNLTSPSPSTAWPTRWTIWITEKRFAMGMAGRFLRSNVVSRDCIYGVKSRGHRTKDWSCSYLFPRHFDQTEERRIHRRDDGDVLWVVQWRMDHVWTVRKRGPASLSCLSALQQCWRVCDWNSEKAGTAQRTRCVRPFSQLGRTNTSWVFITFWGSLLIIWVHPYQTIGKTYSSCKQKL